MHKALSESKANTNWTNPNKPWLKACDHFIEAILDRQHAHLFWEDFLPFATELSWRGMNLSLTQTVLKLTSPGVPDFYQGNEIWDFSLVDPDNRRPVDYALRRDFLRDLDKVSTENLFKSWKDGRIKMNIIRSILHYRRECPDLFSQGSYTPLGIEGPNADRFISFMRQHGEEQLLVIALTRLGREKIDHLSAAIGEGNFLSTSEPRSEWHDLLSHRKITKPSKQFPVEALLNGLPAGIFRSVFKGSRLRPMT